MSVPICQCRVLLSVGHSLMCPKLAALTLKCGEFVKPASCILYPTGGVPIALLTLLMEILRGPRRAPTIHLNLEGQPGRSLSVGSDAAVGSDAVDSSDAWSRYEKNAIIKKKKFFFYFGVVFTLLVAFHRPNLMCRGEDYAGSGFVSGEVVSPIKLLVIQL